jgi:hypothetical protein
MGMGKAYRCSTFMCARHEPLFPAPIGALPPGSTLSGTSEPATPSTQVMLRPVTAPASVMASRRSVREARLITKMDWNCGAGVRTCPLYVRSRNAPQEWHSGYLVMPCQMLPDSAKERSVGGSDDQIESRRL